MNKKVMSFLCMALFCLLTITGCGNTSETSMKKSNNKVDNQEDKSEIKSKNKISDSDDISEKKDEKDAEKEKEKAYKQVNFDDVIKTDFLEVVLTKGFFSKEIHPEKPADVYGYMKEQEGKTYFCVMGTLKNTGGEKYYIDSSTCDAKIIFDDKYTYRGSFITEKDGDMDAVLVSFDPLEQNPFGIYVCVPKEIEESYSKVRVEFGFNEGFATEEFDQTHWDYQYFIEINK